MTLHRKRRVAADEAHSWARNLRLKNPYAKLVLCMLTLYVDGTGSCFVGIDQLAEDTELSCDTVRKRLAWLEQVAAIARFPQWLDANGRRNGDGRGKRTTDEIRLLIHADTEEIERKACGEITDDAVEFSPSSQQGLSEHPSDDLGDASPSPQQGLNQPQDSVSPRPALGQPSHCGEGLISEPEPEKKDFPPTPQEGGGDSKIDQGSEAKKEPEGWTDFKTAFEADGFPILRVSIAMPLFSALSIDERSLVTRAASGLIAHRAREKKPGIKPSAQTFIREIAAWPSYAKLAPPPPPLPPRFIASDSEEFRALRVFDVICGLVPREPKNHPAEGIGIIAQVAELRPDVASLVKFSNADGSIETASWHVFEDRTKNFYAWAERIEEWTGNRPEARRILTGGQHPFTWNNKTTMMDNFVMGLRVPLEWPPRKDGTIPPSEITDEDREEFLKRA